MFTLLVLCFAYAFAQQITPATDPVEFRKFVADKNGVENSISVAGAKVIVTQTGETSGTGEVDLAGFKFVAGGGVNNRQVALGFTALSASASVDWTPNSQGSSFVYSITGAWVEVVLGLSHILAYKERNTVPGLQYNLGDNVWDCDTSPTDKDCVIKDSGIEVAKLSYSSLTVTKDACPANGYSTNCSVWTISTIGSDPVGGTPIFELSFRVANQKVISGTHQIGPDYGKVDWTIRYPWTAKGIDKNTANVAIAGYVGGKVGTAGIVGGSFQGKDAFYFKGDNNKAAVLAWDGTATIGNKDSAIYVQSISGKSIADFDCTNVCDLTSLAVITIWKIYVGLASLGGWTSELVILSWDGVGADAVVYDPTIGMSDAPNAGSFLIPSFFSIICTWVFFIFFRQ